MKSTLTIEAIILGFYFCGIVTEFMIHIPFLSIFLSLVATPLTTFLSLKQLYKVCFIEMTITMTINIESLFFALTIVPPVILGIIGYYVVVGLLLAWLLLGPLEMIFLYKITYFLLPKRLKIKNVGY